MQRGRDEVRVYVRYPEARRQSIGDVEDLLVRLPDGTAAPLSEVAEYELGEGFTQIGRLDRRRVINVSADVDASLANTADVNTLLTGEVLPGLQRRYPSLRYGLEGEQQEQAESMNSLGMAMLVAVGGIYILLAAQFRSYVQPLIVMSAIPFGLVGAVWGHIAFNTVRDMPLNFLSHVRRGGADRRSGERLAGADRPHQPQADRRVPARWRPSARRGCAAAGRSC